MKAKADDESTHKMRKSEVSSILLRLEKSRKELHKNRWSEAYKGVADDAFSILERELELRYLRHSREELLANFGGVQYSQ